MPKTSKARAEAQARPETLKGWKEIAAYLGEPVSVVKRWALEGMPVVEQGRLVTTSPEQLDIWLRREVGKPVRVVNPQTDLTAELKRGIAFARTQRSREA